MSERNDRLRLRISVSIQPESGNYTSNGNLEVREDFEIPQMGFLEMCRILGQFQELASKFKASRAGGGA
ncbi:MAG: hypothetical protein L3K18_09580 [Thermoplasmata archaeon]|nr:hypothetical protein [Thermoplasmata archaeon]